MVKGYRTAATSGGNILAGPRVAEPMRGDHSRLCSSNINPLSVPDGGCTWGRSAANGADWKHSGGKYSYTKDELTWLNYVPKRAPETKSQVTKERDSFVLEQTINKLLLNKLLVLQTMEVDFIPEPRRAVPGRTLRRLVWTKV